LKNHIVFKFLAILLCAAMLLTGLAGAVGIFALNETGLYYRTFDEAYGDYLERELEQAGQEIAQRYAAQELGGLSYRMQDAYFGSYSFLESSFSYGRMGYQLKDPQGNVLQSRDLNAAYPAAQRHTVRIDAVPYPRAVEVKPFQVQQTEPVVTYAPEAGGAMVYDMVPLEGITVDRITVSYSDSSEGLHSPGGAGTLWHDSEGRVVFQSSDPWMLDVQAMSIIAISFDSDTHGRLFEASDPNGVGEMYYDEDGFVVFRSAWGNPEFGAVATEPTWTMEATEASLAPTEAETDVTQPTQYNGYSSGANIYSAPNENAEVLGTVPAEVTCAVSVPSLLSVSRAAAWAEASGSYGSESPYACAVFGMN